VGDRSPYADKVSEYYGGKFQNPDVGRRVPSRMWWKLGVA
jgi:hypothetical protein